MKQENINTTQSPVHDVVAHQLFVMETFLQGMVVNVQEAQTQIKKNNLDGAIGALYSSEEAFSSVNILFEALKTIHRNAYILGYED